MKPIFRTVKFCRIIFMAIIFILFKYLYMICICIICCTAFWFIMIIMEIIFEQEFFIVVEIYIHIFYCCFICI